MNGLKEGRDSIVKQNASGRNFRDFRVSRCWRFCVIISNGSFVRLPLRPTSLPFGPPSSFILQILPSCQADFFLIITYVPNVRDMQQISPNFACETSAPLSSLKFGGLDCHGATDPRALMTQFREQKVEWGGKERIKEGRRRIRSGKNGGGRVGELGLRGAWRLR